MVGDNDDEDDNGRWSRSVRESEASFYLFLFKLRLLVFRGQPRISEKHETGPGLGHAFVCLEIVMSAGTRVMGE